VTDANLRRRVLPVLVVVVGSMCSAGCVRDDAILLFLAQLLTNFILALPTFLL